MSTPGTADFGIEIDFHKNSENPERVFRAMSELLVSLKQTDHILIRSIDSGIEPIMLLEDIESGSIKAWLSQLLKQVNDDALLNLDWKPLVGQYLVKGKYLVLDFMHGKTTITDRKEVTKLLDDIQTLAEQTGVNRFPIYTKPNPMRLLRNVNSISDAAKLLGEGDTATYLTRSGERVGFNLDLTLSPESLEDLITKETIENSIASLVKVKKPDYLGESMWSVKFQGRTVDAKILDIDFLRRFQNREVDIRPGDSLRVVMKVTAKYGFDNEHLGNRYEIEAVHGVEPASGNDPELFEDEQEE